MEMLECPIMYAVWTWYLAYHEIVDCALNLRGVV
jgi:hypothetical protein